MSRDCHLASKEEVDPLQPIWEKSLQLDGVRIIDSCFRPAHFPEHSHPQIKIAVPLEDSSIQVNWQTASGDRKYQLTSCTWESECQNHDYVQGELGVQY